MMGKRRDESDAEYAARQREYRASRPELMESARVKAREYRLTHPRERRPYEPPSTPEKLKKRRWSAREYMKRRRLLVPEKHKEQQLRSNLKCLYGITPEEYQSMFVAQGGVCAICRKSCSTGRRLSVDHDHATGRLRGLLCMHCNHGLGKFADEPTVFLRAFEYLTYWSE